MKIECYLIIAKVRGKEPSVRRVTKTRGYVDHNEAIVKLQLDLPDDMFEAPLITIPVERRQVAVGVEVDEPI